MKPVIALVTFALLLTGCASDLSPNGAAAQRPGWSSPPFPPSPPPIQVKRYFGLTPPRYPDMERRHAIYGEVLLEVVVGQDHHLAGWRVVRATTEGYARSVLATMSTKGVAPDSPPGRYLYSVVFSGADADTYPSRPGTLWVATDGFGSQ